MIIKRIDIYHICVPLVKPYHLSKKYGTLHDSENIITKLTTDNGIIGFGETVPDPLFAGESVETVKLVIKDNFVDALIGGNPCDIKKIHHEMEQRIKGHNMAKAAIEIACYDLLGKKSGLPVHSFLGEKIWEQIPTMWSIGNNELGESISEAIERQNEGYASLMIKVGSESIEKDADRVQAVRKAVGFDYPLILDANEAWHVEDAIAFAKLVESFNISLFEQPVAFWDFEGLRKVKENTTIPISADESLFTIHDAKRLIEMKAVDVFSIKVAKHGGIFKAKAIIDLANIHEIPCLMNSMTEEGIAQAASLQLGASVKNLWKYGNAYFSPLRLKEDITDFSSSIRNGLVHISDRPGLGINVKEDIIEKYTVDTLHLT